MLVYYLGRLQPQSSGTQGVLAGDDLFVTKHKCYAHFMEFVCLINMCVQFELSAADMRMASQRGQRSLNGMVYFSSLLQFVH